MAKNTKPLNIESKQIVYGDQMRISLILGLAILMTTVAELFYLFVWGFWLFPEGSWGGKTVWTLTCGLAMGAVIGSLTLLLAEPRRGNSSAFWIAASGVFIVGSYCAWLCSNIDARFNYFGGAENGLLFVVSGIIPAVLGGLFYGWLIYSPSPSAMARRNE